MAMLNNQMVVDLIDDMMKTSKSWEIYITQKKSENSG